MGKLGSQEEETRRSLTIGQVATALACIAGLISVSHSIVFTRSEGKELADQLKSFQEQTREDFRELRGEVHDLTKALIGRGKSTAKASPTPEARVSRTVASTSISTKERRREMGREFFLNSFGEDVRNDPFIQSPVGKSR